MPLERSGAILGLSDPNIVLGPRKRRPTERLLENGDPLASKKIRKDNVSPGDTGATVSNTSADKGKHTLSPMLPPTQSPHTMPRAREATNDGESNSDGTSDVAQAIAVDDSDEEGGDEGKYGSDEVDEGATANEDDDAELGVYSITLSQCYLC